MTEPARKPARAIPLRRIEARVTGVPNAMVGDEVYYHHATHGPTSGRVLAVGRDGCQIEHPDGHVPVLWTHILGHKQRAQRDLAIVDQGEDGSIGVDADGNRVYIRGPLGESDAESDAERMAKALPAELPAVLGATAPDLGPLAAALQEMAKAWSAHLEREAARATDADIRREALDASLLKSQAEIARTFSAALGDVLKAHGDELQRLHGEVATLHGLVAGMALAQPDDGAPAAAAPAAGG